MEVYIHQSELAHELNIAQESNANLQEEENGLKEEAKQAKELITRVMQEKFHAKHTLEQLCDQAEQAERSTQQANDQYVQE